MSEDNVEQKPEASKQADAAKDKAAAAQGGWNERRTGAERRHTHTSTDRHGRLRTENYAGPDRRSGIDRRAYLERQRARIRHEKAAFLNRALLTFALLFIPIVLAGVFIMAPEYVQLKMRAAQEKFSRGDTSGATVLPVVKPMPAVAAQDKSVPVGAVVNQHIEQLKNAREQVNSTARALLDSASQVTAVAAPAMAEAAKNIAAGDVAAAQGNLQAMLQVLANYRQYTRTPEGRRNLSASMSRLNTTLSSWQGDADGLNQAVEVARQQDPVLQGLTAHVEPKDLGAAAMLLTLNELRGNVGREAAFKDDLALVQKFAGADPELQKSINTLAPYAESGVLSRATLQQEFKGLAMDIVAAKLKGENLTVQEQALKRFDKLVRVRKIDDIEGNSTDAVVARAQKMLDAGDVAGAVRELQTLEGAPAQKAAPFIDAAQGHLGADTAAATLSDQILRRLSTPSGFSLEGLSGVIDSGLPNLSPPASVTGGGPAVYPVVP